MPSYIPEFVYGPLPGTYCREFGLIPWPEHMRPHEMRPDISLTKKGERYVAGAQVPDFIPTINIDGGTVFLTCKEGHRLSISTTIERLIDMLDAMEPDPDLEPYLGSGDDREGCGGAWGGDEDHEPSLGWSASGHPGQNANFASDWGDLEADDSDDEPSLGAPEARFAGANYSPSYGPLAPSVAPIGSQEQWAIGGRDDREDDGDDREPDNDEELTLGWSEEQSLCGALDGGTDDREGELGWTEHVDQTVAALVEQDNWIETDGEPDLGFVGHGTGWREGEGTDDREGDHDDREPDIDGGVEDLAFDAESDCYIPGGGSVDQYKDGWRADPNYVPPVKKPARRPARRTVVLHQPAVDGERSYYRNEAGIGNLPPEAMEGIVPEIRVHRSGGAPC